jgi:hypothetical protein
MLAMRLGTISGGSIDILVSVVGKMQKEGEYTYDH